MLKSKSDSSLEALTALLQSIGRRRNDRNICTPTLMFTFCFIFFSLYPMFSSAKVNSHACSIYTRVCVEYIGYVDYCMKCNETEDKKKRHRRNIDFTR